MMISNACVKVQNPAVATHDSHPHDLILSNKWKLDVNLITPLLLESVYPIIKGYLHYKTKRQYTVQIILGLSNDVSFMPKYN